MVLGMGLSKGIGSGLSKDHEGMLGVGLVQ